MNNKSFRLAKLLYIFSLVILGLSLPIYYLSYTDFASIYEKSYYVKCNNGEYVVLQGSRIGEKAIYNNIYINSDFETKIKQNLNFYCKYYEEIQPFIIESAEKPGLESNLNFIKFKNTRIDNVMTYPLLFEFELFEKELKTYRLYSPLLDWLVIGFFAFTILQIIRMSYLYVQYGDIVWHPFKYRNKKTR